MSCFTSVGGIELWLFTDNNQSLIPSIDVIQLTLTLKMTTAKLSKQQSVSAIVLFRTRFTRTIMLNLLICYCAAHCQSIS